MSFVKNLEAIHEGFKNYIFPDEEVEKIARGRAEICAGCEHANPNTKFKKLLEDKKTEIISGMGCNICGCFLSAKIRQSIQMCPEKKW